MTKLLLAANVLLISSEISCQYRVNPKVENSVERYDRLYPPVRTGWNNLYKNNKMLAGLVISQVFPEGSIDQNLYLGKHPAGIAYYFWDGTRVEYWYIKNNSGGTNLEIKHSHDAFDVSEWNWVDFSYGSDPILKNHHDPRINGIPNTTNQINLKIIKKDICDGKVIYGDLTVFNGKSASVLR